jgi:hypothetical protein
MLANTGENHPNAGFRVLSSEGYKMKIFKPVIQEVFQLPGRLSAARNNKGC